MSFPTGQENGEYIISQDRPEVSKQNTKSKFSRLFEESVDYDEIYEFLRDQNITASGACTLFPKSEIQRYRKMGAIGVLMRGPSGKLIGTIFSIPFPIKCSFSSEPVTHGCTTFLNVHEKLRGHGLCKSLIKELSLYGYENNHLCGYFLNSFKLTPTSIPITSWYHPIDLPKTVALGFGFPNWNSPSHFHENRIKYSCKLPKEWKCKIVTTKKSETILELYQSFVSEKKFA
jgi:hypothetical protein